MENVCPTCKQLLPQKKYPTKIFVATKVLNVRMAPDSTSDENVIGKLFYDEEAEPLALENGWYKINYQGKEAWVSAGFVQDTNYKSADAVNLQVGSPNFAQDQNTIIIRKIINDEFGGGSNCWDLQCTEYVQYKIKQRGIDIKWPVRNNRNGGNWAAIFEKFGMYKILNEPKAGCAASFAVTGKMPYGHVAFVEKVEADGSLINISEANWPGSGKYFERQLNKTQWKDQYQIRFIDFSEFSNQKDPPVLGAMPILAPDIEIFLSHSDEDKDLAKIIKSSLGDRGFNVFLACEDIKLGSAWSAEIINKIRNCRFFLALRTENFYTSTVAEQECGIALGIDKMMIPLFVDVNIDECGFLRERQGFIFDKQKIKESCTELAKKLKEAYR